MKKMKKHHLLSIVKAKNKEEKGVVRQNKKMQTDFFVSHFFYKHITRMISGTYNVKKNETI